MARASSRRYSGESAEFSVAGHMEVMAIVFVFE